MDERIKVRARVSVSLYDEIERARTRVSRGQGIKPLTSNTFLVYLLQTGLRTHQLLERSVANAQNR